MAETMPEIKGQCLCGAVRFTTSAPQKITLCHCGMCRKWGGGLPLAGFEAAVSLSQSDSLRWWKSSEWGERGFCGDCGASLFWRAPGMDEWEVSAGAVDSTDGAQIDAHIFIDDKPDFYDFAGVAPRITGAECTAAALSRLAAQFGGDFLGEALEKSRRHHGEKFATEVARLITVKKS